MQEEKVLQPLEGISLPSGVANPITREKLSMAKGKPQETAMTAKNNSISLYSIQTNVLYKKEAYLDPTFDDVPLLRTWTQRFIHATSSQQKSRAST
jgi:hypothetical protein